GDYKLVEVFETGAVELYNLRDDLGEQHDLSGSMPELAGKMKKMLEAWRAESGSLMTRPNPDYDPEHDWRKPEKPVAAEADKTSGKATND
ncbi:MAG: hypothetical protein GWO24_24215, partial [Akkermansiaceae bacterium]|nr:hypothetical protein [Akkermansiaceae bacterium]